MFVALREQCLRDVCDPAELHFPGPDLVAQHAVLPQCAPRRPEFQHGRRCNAIRKRGHRLGDVSGARNTGWRRNGGRFLKPRGRTRMMVPPRARRTPASKRRAGLILCVGHTTRRALAMSRPSNHMVKWYGRRSATRILAGNDARNDSKGAK